MNYQEFKKMLKDRMQDLMGDAIEVGYETYTKNNQTEIEAMTFKEKKPQAKIIISPAIHLQDLYELYKKNGDDETFMQCLRQIQTLYLNREPKSLERMDDDWEEIRRNINLTLMHEEWNQKWLEEKQVPYSRFLDFAVILRRSLEIPAHNAATMVVTRDLMNHWNVPEDKLWETAWNNLEEEKFYIQDLNTVLGCEIQEAEQEINTLDFSSMPSLYIMSNKERYYGARAILRTDLLQDFAEKADCNLYILPTSTHEIMLLPDHGEFKAEKLRADVRKINTAYLEADDQLSDEIYYFKKDSGNVEIAK